MAGLLDFLNTDQGRMGLGLLAAAGPRTDGAGFGQRLQEGMGSFDAYKQNQLKTKHAEMQMQEYEQGVTQKQQAAAEQARIRGIVSQGGTDWQGMIRAGVPVELVKQLAESQNFGRSKVARTAEVEGPNGQKMVQSFDDYGQQVGQGVNGYVAPQLIDQGDRKTFAKPMLGASFPVGMSPESAASNALGWANNAATLRGQDMTDSRARERLSFEQGGGADSGGTTQVQFNKQFGKAPAGYRWTANGAMEFIPGGPADQKAQAQKGGEGTVGGVVADLRDKYSQLDKESGIVSTNNRIGTNLGAAFGASSFGQTLNGMVGTKTQSARDSIAMTRPLLLQSIMKATGMSAKQMDSNAELKLYLATATDPQKGLEANMEALDRIEALYGGGGGFKTSTPSAKSSSGWSIQKAD